MAVTAALVYAGHDRLRYLVTAGGGGGGNVVITSTGAASPDVLTDSLAGPLKSIANAVANGYGKLPAGALNQAQARALWASHDPTNLVSNSGMPITAICTLAERDAASNMHASVAVDVSAGNPTITVTAAADGTCYLDVTAANTIGA